MNTKAEIREVGKWINDYWDKGHDIITPDVYEDLLKKCDIDAILYMGCKLVKQPKRTFIEMPEKYIAESRIEAAATIYGIDE